MHKNQSQSLAIKTKAFPWGKVPFSVLPKKTDEGKTKKGGNSALFVLVYRSYAFGNPDDFFWVNISLDPKHVFVFAPDNGTFSIF